jgi:hypothetical protein
MDRAFEAMCFAGARPVIGFELSWLENVVHDNNDEALINLL